MNAKCGTRESECRAWRRRRRDGKAAGFKKDGLKGLWIVQPKNNENGVREREGWPLTWGHYRKGDYGCSKLSKHSPRDPS